MPTREIDQERWLDDWADRIHRSGLATVTLPLLEISRGLGFVAGQAVLLAQPILTGLIDKAQMEQWIALLENPGTVERLIERIEQKEASDG